VAIDPMRLDDLAREAGVATTTVRLYRSKGLLPPPRLVGRTGFYDDTHLARLRLIARLQDEGFSLAGIGRLLETWQQGRSLDDVVGVEQQLDALLHHRRGVVLSPEELLDRFPDGALTPDLVQRAAKLGLVEMTDDGRFHVPDARFLDTGAAMLELGVPADVILDEWEHLAAATDDIAARFVALFEEHLLPAEWRVELDDERARALAGTLARLQLTAGQVLAAALDASVARIGAQRLAELVARQDD
jgi:DNA-binding transcriptional MerR regulator